MAYSDFTLNELKKRFGLKVHEQRDLFSHIAPQTLPATLEVLLRRYLPLALNLNTEKARSELIIAPFLTELKLLYAERISLFSGLEFNVDEASGLKGRCDFILAESPEQLVLTAPVCVLVEATQARQVHLQGQEAKNENIIAGLAQCLAEMIAAQRFNLAAGLEPAMIYGVVTTGMLWRFLQLEPIDESGLNSYVDKVEYSIQNAEKLFGILKHIALSE